MGAVARDHEPPAAPATVAVLLAPVSFYLGLYLPVSSTVRHVLLGTVFGAVGVLCGWRATRIAGRRIAVRVWSWVGIVIGGIGLVMLWWQVLSLLTGNAFPPPFWSPYAHP
ncbi:hypothetical protein Csp2054_08965 [Curtobacterium sp. 'Ferrero']|uniref:hypothetical protein n=1 Tax=Curtobacterium sp. 'Ferrero' TaxID=2033654 RepID=UPI000BD23F69|nr:hypothetical protein [Curtobacterium sp. 'Ferrero']PCN47993.1 hypothetical protein Csp2054_08965 [Curtobacterium sp. 'Ferrero']